MQRSVLLAVVLVFGSLGLLGCEGPRPHRGSPGQHGQSAVNDEAHFQRLLANEQTRYRAEQRRTEAQRDHDIAQTHSRFRYRPRYELDQEIHRLESHYRMRIENERIAHERNMNNIIADRDQQRSRRAIDGIFNLPPFRR